MTTLRIPKPMSSASMVLSVVANHLLPHGETIYRRELLALMALLDMNVGTAGSAATRLAELGWLWRRRTGRFTHYTVTHAARRQIAADEILRPAGREAPKEEALAELKQELTWFLRRYRSEQTAVRNQIHHGHGSPMSAENCFVRLFWLTYEFQLLRSQGIERLLPIEWSTEAVTALHDSYSELLRMHMGDFLSRRAFTMPAVI